MIYSANQLRDIQLETSDDGTRTLSVQPMLETAFYLAGARISKTEDGHRVELVRCPVSKTCPVDVPASVEPGGDHPYRIELASGLGPVEIVYQDGQVQRL